MIAAIVAGSRTIEDRNVVWEGLDKAFERVAPDRVIVGKARGPDTYGEWWAIHHGYRVDEFPADWDTHGKSAGYRRNEQMGEFGTHLIAFYDGLSRGTRHMIDIARNKGLRVRIFRTDSPTNTFVRAGGAQ